MGAAVTFPSLVGSKEFEREGSTGQGWNQGERGTHSYLKRPSLFQCFGGRRTLHINSKNLSISLAEEAKNSCRPCRITPPAIVGKGRRGHHSGLPTLPLGHPGLRGGPMEPLKPGAIIDGHIGLATEVSGQGNVAGSDTLPACGNEGLCKVHLLGLEHGTELLRALFKAILCQEVHERHVDRALDVT